MMKAWVYFADSYRDSEYRTMMDSLLQAGICCEKLDFEDPWGYGLIFFSNISDCLLNRLTKFRNLGCVRMLALAVDSVGVTNADTWRLMSAGASDIISWRNHSEAVETVLKRLERWQAIDELLESGKVKDIVVGRNITWRSVLQQIIEVARFTSANLLILGESGTGKELIARLIHSVDPKYCSGEFFILDCSTIVPELSGSEFFGHERGAFTGAYATRDGAFALANGGCLFLDEVGELPLPLQGQLLRVVQEGEFKRVGGNTWFKTDFRLICATNRDLAEAVRKKYFRHDLYHRIANWIFTLPPLRERPDDILNLSRHFIEGFQSGNDAPQLTQAVQDYLLQREYPGNVRELQHLVSRIMQRHVGPGPLTPGDIPKSERPTEKVAALDWRNGIFECTIECALAQGVSLKEIGRSAEEVAVRLAVREADGNLQRAAERLGVTDRTLQLRRAADRRALLQEPEPSEGSGDGSD